MPGRWLVNERVAVLPNLVDSGPDLVGDGPAAPYAGQSVDQIGRPDTSLGVARQVSVVREKRRLELCPEADQVCCLKILAGRDKVAGVVPSGVRTSPSRIASRSRAMAVATRRCSRSTNLSRSIHSKRLCGMGDDRVQDPDDRLLGERQCLTLDHGVCFPGVSRESIVDDPLAALEVKAGDVVVGRH